MVYIFLADGFEIIEAMAPLDMLRRAKVNVQTVGVTGKTVTSSCGAPVTADILPEDVQLNDALQAVVIPGGLPGTLNLEKAECVQNAIDYAAENGKYLCAICAGPSVLGHKHLLEGKSAIAYPGFEKELYGAEISKEHVVRDGNVITAKGAGVCVDFGLKIVEALCGKSVSDNVRSSIQCK